MVLFDLDTDDYQSPLSTAQENFSEKLAGSTPEEGSWLVIAHDIQPTAAELARFMVGEMKKGGWRGVTVGECLGDERGNWYRKCEGGELL